MKTTLYPLLAVLLLTNCTRRKSPNPKLYNYLPTSLRGGQKRSTLMKTNLHKYWLWIVVLTASICWGTSCSDTELHTGQQLLFPARHKGLWGYIDQTGKMVIEPEYVAAEPFGDGLAPICIEVDHVRKWGYVDGLKEALKILQKHKGLD